MLARGAMGAHEARFGWVDAAKGICIILVVMMHATLGVEKAMGEVTSLNAFIAWARPFRMPDFFLISGLFLAARIDRPWRIYADTKVLHFAYFYILWLHIQLGLKTPHFVDELGWLGFAQLYLTSYVAPFSTLWFIYLLSVFFVAAKALHGLSKPLVLCGAVAMHILAPETGIFIVDQFTERFVFFFTGYAAAPMLFEGAIRVSRTPAIYVVTVLCLWASLNTYAVGGGLAAVPVIDLVFSFAGIAAVLAASVVIACYPAGRALAYCGRNSIVIYLAFAVFMAGTRQVLIALNLGLSADIIALASLVAGVVAPLVLARMIDGTALSFLFVRPEAFSIAPAGVLPRRGDGRKTLMDAGLPSAKSVA